MSLLIEMEDQDGIVKYAHYKEFKIEAESMRYNLSVLKEYSGDAGDSMISTHLHHPFITYDIDETAKGCATTKRMSYTQYT